MTEGNGGVSVLHVDDDPGFADLTAEYLARQDDRLAVTVETNPEAALDHIASGSYDCVVSDYDMPEMTGIDLLEAVREDHPDLPFILFTGKGSEEVASDAISAGVSDYLEKASGAERYELLANRITNLVSQSRAERAVETQRNRFRRLFEQFPEPTLAYTYEGGEPYVARVNEAFRDVFGTDSPLGRHVDEVVVPPEYEAEARRIDERVKAGEAVDEVLWRAAADGHRAFHFRNITLPDDADIDGFGIYTDITERIERERDLERQNDLFRKAQRLADVGAWEYDIRADALTWTEQVYDIHDLSPDETLTAEEAIEYYHPDDRDRVRAAFTGAVEDGEPYDVEARLVTATDAERWVRTRGDPQTEDGETVRVRGTIQDVTDHKERRHKLEQLQRRTQWMMGATTEAATARIAVDAATEVLDAPLSGVHLVADDGPELVPVAVSRTVSEQLDGPPTYGPSAPEGSASALVWEVFENGEAVRMDDLREHDVRPETTAARSAIVHPLGNRGVFIVSATEPDAFDADDEAFIDVVTASLSTALARLDRETQLRNRERELQRHVDHADRFASVVGHDLRNPLNLAQGRLELAREDCDSDHLDIVASAHDRMESLIEDLLTLTRVGDPVETTEPVDIATAVADCWELVETGDATLRVADPPTVRADASRLKQLFENLFRNSVEHGSTGSRPQADDAVEHAGEGVTVEVGPLDDGTGFYVADDGPGVPADDREHVFETGYSTGGGTGLGLSIVEEVAKAHRWDVRLVDSDAGGARFEFTAAGSGTEGDGGSLSDAAR